MCIIMAAPTESVRNQGPIVRCSYGMSYPISFIFSGLQLEDVYFSVKEKLFP